MRQMCGLYSRSRKKRLVGWVFPFAAWVALPSPGIAQGGSMQQVHSELEGCVVFPGVAAVAGLQEVRAVCWGVGLTLGEAESFRTSFNRVLKATIVELKRGQERRVILLRPDVEGRPMIEDISGDLAAAVGRAPWAGLQGLTPDFSEFAESASIVVETQDPGAAPQGLNADADRLLGKAVRVRIDEHIVQDPARFSAKN